jgi:hypothetical protein
VHVCDHCARETRLRTQKVQVNVDPALGIGPSAVEVAQTRLAVPVANRRDALDSSRLYNSCSALRTPARGLQSRVRNCRGVSEAATAHEELERSWQRRRVGVVGSWWEPDRLCSLIRRIAQAQAGARIGFAQLQHQKNEIKSHWAMWPSDATPVKQYREGTRRLGDDIWWQLRIPQGSLSRPVPGRGEQVVPAESGSVRAVRDSAS